MNIYVNGRFHVHKVTGVQRVAHEITRRISSSVEVCQPMNQLRGWRGHLWEQTALARHCRDGVLWSPCASGPVTGARQVVTFHDLFVLDFPEWYRRSYASWSGFTLRKLAHSAERIIAVSEYTKSRIIQRLAVDPAKITVIHNGVDASWSSASLAAAPAARYALELPSPNYLLSLGSLEPRKNLKSLLAAWATVVHEMPADLWLVIAGASDANVYESAGFSALPARVFLAGYVPDRYLQGLYAGSLGFVYPSLAEGFGLPPLEAMACGIPVITSNTTALPEVCSSAALYFDPKDVSSIAKAIHTLVQNQNLRARLALLGREQAARFNWERTAEQTLRLLRAISSPTHCL